MTAEQLAKILMKYPDKQVEMAAYVYANEEDSCGYYEFQDVLKVNLKISERGKKLKEDRMIIALSSSPIGYPDEKDDYEDISENK